jgi:tetratricopeptide (TPR) repeat protein
MGAGTSRRGINVLWGMLGMAAVFMGVRGIANRPPTSVRVPLKILTPPFTANRGEILEDLRARKFQVLDAQLNSYEKAFEENVLEEDNLALAFDTFKFSDPTVLPILDEWVKSDPNSYPAHLARAKQLLKLGWAARGDRFANQTSERQFSEMKRLFRASFDDAVAAIRLNPEGPLPYALLISAATSLSSAKEMLQNVYAASLKNVPLSLETREGMMNALTPRWGGSYEAMAAFAAEAQKYAAQNPRLVSLIGYADLDKADLASSAGDYRAVVRLCNQALAEGGDFAKAYKARGWGYYWLHCYDDALEDFNRANRLHPQDADTLVAIAYADAALNRPKDTLALIEEYQTFAQADGSLLNLAKWAQNFDAGSGTGSTVKTGGN